MYVYVYGYGIYSTYGAYMYVPYLGTTLGLPRYVKFREREREREGLYSKPETKLKRKKKTKKKKVVR